MTEGEKITGGARKRPVGAWLRPEACIGEELKKMAEAMSLILPGIDPAECGRLLTHLGHPERARKRRAA